MRPICVWPENESAQKKLHTEADLTFAKATEIVEGIEAAEASTQQFNCDSTPTVHYMHQLCSHSFLRFIHKATAGQLQQVT